MQRHLKRWLEKGLITKEKYLELLDDIIEQKEKIRKIKVQVALYTIGAILLGIGIILFIAANDWLLALLNSMRFLKSFLLSLITFLSFYFGYVLAYEKHIFEKLGKTLIFLSTILLGATYALLAQIYNIEANTPLLYFIWFLSIFPLSFIFKNNAINILSIILFLISIVGYYSNIEADCTILIPLITASILYGFGNISKIRNDFYDFCITYKIPALIIIYITLLILMFYKGDNVTYDEIPIQYIIGTIFALGLNIYNLISYKNKTELIRIETIFISILFFFALSPIVYTYMNSLTVRFIANTLIIFMIYQTFSFGYKFENIKLTNLAIKQLTIFLLIWYIRFINEYLKGALAYILSGIILVVIGIYFEKNKNKLYPKKNKTLE